MYDKVLAVFNSKDKKSAYVEKIGDSLLLIFGKTINHYTRLAMKNDFRVLQN